MDSGQILQYQTFTFKADVLKEILFSFLAFFGLTSQTASSPDALFSLLYSWWVGFSIISLSLSALFLYGIIYTRMKYGHVHHQFVHDLEHAEHEYARLTGAHPQDTKMDKIMSHAHSDNPNDWRLAIIEADIMLEALLEEQGYHGTTIGEKLKGANRTSFAALDDAWTAHKVRNDIAHQGSDFILTKRIVNETLMHYKRAFDELSGGDGHSSGGGHH